MTPTNSAPLTAIQRFALRAAHPRKLMIDSAGFLWMAYFLWNQAMLEAMLVMFAFGVISLLLVRKVDPRAMAETFLGKIALLHLHPGNFLVQLIAFGVLAYGIWRHSTQLVLLAISLVLIGQSFGWGRTDSKLWERAKLIT